MKRFCIVAYAFCFLVPGSHASAARDFQDLILTAEVSGHNLSDGMLAFVSEEVVLLPVVELGLALGFFIESNMSLESIEGWALQPEKYFRVDGRAGKIVLPLRSISISDNAFLEELAVTGEAWLPASQLSEIWPVEIHVELNRLRLLITPQEPLPIQQRLERQGRWDAAGAARATRAAPDLPNLTPRYALYSRPILNTEVTAAFSTDASGAVTVIGYNDFLNSEMNWFFNQTFSSTNQGNGSSVRIRFARDARAESLPWGLEKMKVGDIASSPDEYLVGSIQGRGFSVTNRGGVADIFARTTIDGDAPIGWDAEIHVNGALIDFREIGKDGRYSFEDVPVLQGSNRIEVRLYGPNGQIESRTSTLHVGVDSVPQGDFGWSLRAGDSSPLVPSSRSDTAERWMQSEFSYGLSDFMTLRARVDVLENDEKLLGLARLGTGLSLFGFYVRPELLLDQKATAGGSIALARNFSSASVSLEAAEVPGLELPRLGAGEEAVRRRVSLEANTVLSFGSTNTVLAFRSTYAETMTGGIRWEANARQSFSRGALRLSNQLAVERSGGATTSSGRLLLSRNLQGVDGRMNIGYQPFARNVISNVSVAGGYRSENRDWTVTASLGRDFNAKCFDFQATLSRQFRKVDVGIEYAARYPGRSSFGLRLSSTVEFGPSGRPQIMAGNTIANGRARVRVFLDYNENGQFDIGTDEPLPDIGIRVNQGLLSARTNGQGQITLSDLNSRATTTLAVALRTLQDPFIVPLGDGVRLVARAGTMVQIDLPVVQTGSIDGYVINHNSGGPPRSRTVVIFDKEGKSVGTTMAAYDGYFAFERLRLGAYTIGIGDSGPVHQGISLSADHPFLYGLQIEVPLP